VTGEIAANKKKGAEKFQVRLRLRRIAWTAVAARRSRLQGRG
jgi:hypothetical protein